MIKQTEKQETVVRKQRLCDYCGKAAEKGSCCFPGRCLLCESDLCSDHTHYVADGGGGHDDCYCVSCWSVGVPHRVRLDSLEKDIDLVHEQWKAQALAASKALVQEKEGYDE